jgi:intracellular multiplication protein IcmP
MSQGGGNNQSDPLMGVVLIMAVLAIAGYAAYTAHKEGIHSLILNIRNAEFWIIAKVMWVGGLLSPALARSSANLDDYRQDMMSRPVTNFEWHHIVEISTYAGGMMIWAIAPLMGWLVWFIIFKHPKSVLRRTMSLDTMLNYQSRKWAAITPIVRNDPLNDKDGQWLEALDPKEWAQRHGVDIEDGAPDREAARAALSRQLRRPWTAVGDLPPYMQALVAAFVLRGNKKGDECYELLNGLARGAATNGSAAKALSKDPALVKLVNKTLRDPGMMTAAKKVARQHAWVETAMPALLDWARTNGGVLASADFLWLKLEDRAMWYVLNAVGRPTSFIEAAGAMSHWKAEIVTRRPMPEPDVDEAVFGLEEYLTSH